MNGADASRCATCGGPNACVMAAGAADAITCWCRTVAFAPAALAALPPDLRGRRCLCRTCATGGAASEALRATADKGSACGSNARMLPALPDGVTFTKDPGGRDAVQLQSAAGTVLVALCGAQVLSWRGPRGDVLWTASRSEYAAKKPVRGGIPLVFPWFGDHPQSTTLPAHGFARTLEWRLLRATGTPEVVLEAADDADTRRLWPHAFHLELSIRLTDALEIDWVTENVDDGPIRFEQALHSYFAVGDVATASVHGLEGLACTETASAPEPPWDHGAPLRFRAETDRIFHGVGPELSIAAPALQRTLRLATTHAHSAIVWNPWAAKTARLSQMVADDWRCFCCVESANVREHAVTLGPGERHLLRLTIRCE